MMTKRLPDGMPMCMCLMAAVLCLCRVCHATEPLHMAVQVIGKFPHDPRAFTQGLVIQEGARFERTG